MYIWNEKNQIILYIVNENAKYIPGPTYWTDFKVHTYTHMYKNRIHPHVVILSLKVFSQFIGLSHRIMEKFLLLCIFEEEKIRLYNYYTYNYMYLRAGLPSAHGVNFTWLSARLAASARKSDFKACRRTLAQILEYWI